MRVLYAVPVGALSVSLLVCAPSGGADGAAAPAAVADTVTALYLMDEAPGATQMTDSSGNGHHGVVDPTGVQTGVVLDGETTYSWSPRSPTAMPPSPERIVQVADDDALEPGDQDFTVEVRYRTPHGYGNLIQKGQALANGGQWKIQLPNGRPSCLFQGGIPDNPIAGEDYQITARTLDPIDDNEWHVLRCEFTFIETTGAPTSRVNMFVDGVFKSRKNGLTGPLDNRAPMTIGGKANCGEPVDPGEEEITCDYFTGQVDYVKISKSVVNEPPVAAIAPTCNQLTCSFSSADSDDPDGTIESYAWTFGDGGTSSSPNPAPHTYALPGRYQVKLTVTDNGGETDSATRSVNVVSGEVPTKPRQPSAAPGDRSAVVSWLKPGKPGVGVSGYLVTSSPGGEVCSTTTELSCRVRGLTNEQPYTFTVMATSAAGNSPESTPTTAVTPIGKPLAPGSVTVVPGNRRVIVKWTAANGNGMPVRSYRITSSAGGPAKIVPATALRVVMGGLRNGSVYRFAVAAANVHGVGATRTSAAVKPAGPPRRPSRVTAIARTKAAVVSWRAPAPSGAPVTRYTIMCSGGKKVVVAGGATHVRFPNLKSGGRYAFRVVATNRLGKGPWSAWSRPIRVR